MSCLNYHNIPVELCDPCQEEPHGQCVGERDDQWCECLHDECVLVSYHAVVTAIDQAPSKRRSPLAGVPTKSTVLATAREAAWHQLSDYSGGMLDPMLVREVHRRHRLYAARFHVKYPASAIPDITEAIRSVIADCQEGRL